MRNITISDGMQAVTLLPDLVFTIQPETVANRLSDASETVELDEEEVIDE